MNRYIGIFRASFRRLFGNYRIYISILFLAGWLFFSVGQQRFFCISVINVFTHAVSSVVFMISFIICAFPYANVFTEDLESGYMRYMVIRGGRKQYLAASVLTIMGSSMMVMACGCLVFGVILSFLFPWADEVSLTEMLVRHSSVFREETMWIWILLWGTRMGLQAAVLSVASATLSLFLANRLMVFILPALLYELLQEINVELYENGIVLYNRGWFRLDIMTSWDGLSTAISMILFIGVSISILTAVMDLRIRRRI